MVPCLGQRKPNIPNIITKDKIDGVDVAIQYESTSTMWCDILTDPKQGSVFREFPGHLMKIPNEYDDEAT